MEFSNFYNPCFFSDQTLVLYFYSTWSHMLDHFHPLLHLRTMSASLRDALLFPLIIFLWVTYSKSKGSLIWKRLLFEYYRYKIESPNWKPLLLELRLLMKQTRRYMLFFYSKSNRPRILISSSDIILELSFISVELLFAKVAAAFLIE